MAKQYGQTRLCYVQVITKRQRKPVKSKVVDIDVSAVRQKGQNVRWPHSPLVLPHDESLEACTVIIALMLEKVDTDRQTESDGQMPSQRFAVSTMNAVRVIICSYKRGDCFKQAFIAEQNMFCGDS